tara:strand:- start:2900 stop:3559 length:660 start_codon:yes stop_codon:yes gene_type:complete
MNKMFTHYEPKNFSDKVALTFTKLLRLFADVFFRKRYGHRAVILETVAAVPGMVAGMLNHLKSLRKMQEGRGWIKTLLDEAENERMHLMTFVNIAKPSPFERFLVILVQGIFFNLYFLMYLISPRTCHRIVGYFEEQAIISYTDYLREIDNGNIENIAAPQIAIDYWNLSQYARLRDVVIAVRNDEMGHRDVNHQFVAILDNEAIKPDIAQGSEIKNKK